MNMKGCRPVAVLLALTLLGCATAQKYEAGEVVEFSFLASGGDGFIMRSIHAEDNFGKTQFGSITLEMAVLLVPSLDAPELKLQLDALFNAGPEERTFLVFIADQSSDYTDGYHLDDESTQRLNERFGDGFHILLLDSQSRLLLKSDSVVSTQTIERHFPLEAQ